MATLKELLTAMVDKINGKIVKPDAEPTPFQQLVTDADGVAKWEDKPFGTVRELTPLIPQTDCDASEYRGITIPRTGTLVEGEKYLVTINGIEYVCATQEIITSSLYTSALAIGNGILGDEDGYGNPVNTGEPFCIYLPGNPNLTMTWNVTFAECGHYTVSVSHITETIHSIDPKFIPDLYAKTSDIPTDDHINELISTALAAIPNAEEASF